MINWLKEIFTCSYNLGGVALNEQRRLENWRETYKASLKYVYYYPKNNEIKLLSKPNIENINDFVCDKKDRNKTIIKEFSIIYLGKL